MTNCSAGSSEFLDQLLERACSLGGIGSDMAQVGPLPVPNTSSIVTPVQYAGNTRIHRFRRLNPISLCRGSGMRSSHEINPGSQPNPADFNPGPTPMPDTTHHHREITPVQLLNPTQSAESNPGPNPYLTLFAYIVYNHLAGAGRGDSAAGAPVGAGGSGAARLARRQRAQRS